MQESRRRMEVDTGEATEPDETGFLVGDGEMSALMRRHDWSASALGAPATWPTALRVVVGLMLTSKFPMFVAWGDDLAFLYNDAYRPIFGAKHPQALGRPFAEVWSDIWTEIRPLVDRALKGEATFHENLPLIMERNGFREEAWFTFSYSPVRGEDGRVAGMFCACTETTEKVLADRRILSAETDLRRTNLALERLNETLEERVAARTAEREQAAAELRQAQKMEAVGQLTGGVAHDFNNLLQALTGCLQMIERRTDNPEIRPMLDAGKQAVARGGRLVQQLMAFSRKQPLKPEVVDVRDRVLTMADLLVRALRADIQLVTEFAPDLWPIKADPNQLELVIINLAVNARDAMPDGGRLIIRACNVPGPDAGDGDVNITVEDTGTGMSPEVVSRAFEPFFTTKQTGEGSGLGLAQVYGFARQSGGRVEIDSSPGAGTRVCLILPRTQGSPPAPAPSAATPPAVTRNARVLLVEDEPIVGNVIEAALKDLGYRVERAARADEALARLADGPPVDLLFSDVMMPGPMDGIGLVKAIRQDRPDLPAVLTTGYSKDTARLADVQILPKPFGLAALVEALEAALRRA